MIQRKKYLDRLISYQDKHIIKVLTGIRRCGKSSLLRMFMEYLKNTGIEEEQIIYLNFESLNTAIELDDHLKVHAHIQKRVSAASFEKYYILMDEIQELPQFERLINSLYLDDRFDIYLTGSNAHMLSGELATLLSGRYIEIPVMLLSLKEYQAFAGVETFDENSYRHYLKESSFPYAVLELRNDPQQLYDYLTGIYNTILIKDVIERYKVGDITTLKNLIAFLFDNIGNTFSSKKISDTLKSYGRPISVPTIDNYVQQLINSFLLYKVGRYDLKGKQLLKTQEKYYVCDLALRNLILAQTKTDLGHIFENIVFLELKKAGYEVYIGKVGTLEIDFVALKQGKTEYYQVAYSVIGADGNILEREFEPFYHLQDFYPRTLIVFDDQGIDHYRGIAIKKITDWIKEL